MSEQDPLENPFKQKHKDQNTLKWCSWQVLKDFPEGLTSQQIVEEIQRRQYLDIKKNKNPSGQVAGDFVRNKTKFYRYKEGVWTIRPYYMQWKNQHPQEAEKLEHDLENRKVGKVGRPPKETASKRKARPRESKEKEKQNPPSAPHVSKQTPTIQKQEKNMSSQSQKSVQKNKSADQTEDQPKGHALVGKKAHVWWPDDEQYYAGVISSFNSVEGVYNVDYEDGDSEIIELVEYDVVKKGKAVMVHRSINHGNSSEETISDEDEETETEMERPKKAPKTDHKQLRTNNKNIAGLSDSETVSDEEVKKQSKRKDSAVQSKGSLQKSRLSKSEVSKQDGELKGEIVKEEKVPQDHDIKIEDVSKPTKDEKDQDGKSEADGKVNEKQKRITRLTRSEVHKLESKPVSPKPDFIDSDTESEDIKQKQINIKSSETESDQQQKNINIQQKKYIGRQAFKRRGREEEEEEHMSVEEKNDGDMDESEGEGDEEDEEEEEGGDMLGHKPKKILSFFENAQRGMLPKRDPALNKPTEKKPVQKKLPSAGEVKSVNQKKRQLSKQSLDYEQIRKAKRQKKNIVQIPTRKEPTIQIPQRQQQPVQPIKPPPTPQYETPNQDHEEEQSQKKRVQKSQSRSVCSDSSESNRNIMNFGDGQCLEELLSELDWSQEALDFMTRKSSSPYSGPPMADLLKEFADWPCQDQFAPFFPPQDFEGYGSQRQSSENRNTTSGQISSQTTNVVDDQGKFLDRFIGGSLFICFPDTEDICLNNNIFASQRDNDMKRMAQHSLGVLFNMFTRKLHGIFEYAGQYGECLEPTLVHGKYVYQVRVRPIQKFSPLHESEFGDILYKQSYNSKYYRHQFPIEQVRQLYQRFLRNENKIKEFGMNSAPHTPQSNRNTYNSRNFQHRSNSQYQSGTGALRKQHDYDSHGHTSHRHQNNPQSAISGPQCYPQLPIQSQHMPSQRQDDITQPRPDQMENGSHLQTSAQLQSNAQSQQSPAAVLQEDNLKSQIHSQNAPQPLHAHATQGETIQQGGSLQSQIRSQNIPQQIQPHRTQGETLQQKSNQQSQIPTQNIAQSFHLARHQTEATQQSGNQQSPIPPQSLQPRRSQEQESVGRGISLQNHPHQNNPQPFQPRQSLQPRRSQEQESLGGGINPQNNPHQNSPQSFQPHRSLDQEIVGGGRIPLQNNPPQSLQHRRSQEQENVGGEKNVQPSISRQTNPLQGLPSSSLQQTHSPPFSHLNQVEAPPFHDIGQNSGVGQSQQNLIVCNVGNFGTVQHQERELDELGVPLPPPLPPAHNLRPLSAPLLSVQSSFEESGRFSGQVQFGEEIRRDVRYSTHQAYHPHFDNSYNRDVAPPQDNPPFSQAGLVTSNFIPTPQQPNMQSTPKVFCPPKWESEPYEFDDNSGPGLVWFDDRAEKPSKQSQNKKLQNVTSLPPFDTPSSQPPPQPEEPPPPPPQQQEQQKKSQTQD